jgi:hypothetical protein
MMSKTNYFYIIKNNDWNHMNAIKYGVTANPYERINKCDQHLTRNEYLHLFTFEKMNDYILKGKYDEPDKIISIICRYKEKQKELINRFNLKHLDKINEFIINENGGTEFINNKGIQILLSIIIEDFPKLGLKITQVDSNEVHKINNDNHNNNKDFINKLEFSFSKKEKEVVILRPYQQEICNYILDKYENNNHKIFLELATGAGKTVIAKFIMNKMKSKITKIIIFSPRIDIKEQNKRNISIDGIEIKSYCLQSYERAYNEIICDYKDNQDNHNKYFIWFDEAHWALEDWCKSNDEIKSFFLKDNSLIKYRLFTSASPNKAIVIENKSIFGELYSPIKMKDLMKPEGKYLSEIKCDIFDFQTSKNHITDNHYVKFMIKTFQNKNKTLGFSFHTCCKNAFKLYSIHLKLYEKNNKIPKPYLLINEKLTKKIKYNDINDFEKEEKAFGYVVGRFTMGYDNDRIDILFFSDSKHSYKDNNQAIGRGTRLRKDGSNKILNVIIPTNHNNDIEKDYSNLKGTLEYLIKDVELNIDNISLNTITINKNHNNKITYFNDEDDDDLNYIISYHNASANDNDEKSEIGTIFYDICKREVKWNEKRFANQLMMNNIHNIKDYTLYYNKNKNANLPEPNKIFVIIPKFKYIDTYRKGECPFINKNEYLSLIQENLFELMELFDDNEKINLLISKNPNKKIPNEFHWLFYGDKKSDYF